jgi:hypothetical protein
MSFMDREQLSGTPLREERRARLVRGTLRFANGTVIPILVRNLSERGLGMNCKTRPPVRGESVLITLPGSPELEGVVRWVRDRDFGVELSDSVDGEELATAIREEIARMKEAAEWKVSSLHRVHTPVTNPRRIV